MARIFKNDETGEYAQLDERTGQLVPIAPNPAQEMDAIQAGVVGMGKFGNDVLRNVDKGLNAIGIDSQMALPGDTRQSDAALYDAHPVATRVGEMIPAMAVPAMRLGGLPGRYAGEAVIGALSSDAETSALEGAAWGAGGAGIGDMTARLLGRIGRYHSAGRASKFRTQNKMAEQFTDAGGILTPGQTGGGIAKNYSARLESSPFTGAMFDEVTELNTKLFSQKAARAAGLPADVSAGVERLTKGHLRQAESLVSDRFNDIARQIDSIPISPELSAELNGFVVDKTFKGMMKKVHGVDIPSSGGFALRGQQFMDLRSALNTKIGEAKDMDAIKLYGAIMDDLDTALESVAAPDLVNAYRATRDQYRVNLLLNAAHMSPEGGLTPRNLWNRIDEDDSPLLQELQEFVQPYASGVLQIPFNRSNTGRVSKGAFDAGLNLAEWAALKTTGFARPKVRSPHRTIAPEAIESAQRVGRAGLLEYQRSKEND